MKKYIYLLLSICMLVAFTHTTRAQGCVAVKNMSSCAMNWDDNNTGGAWQFSLNYRYFRSYKHFRGRHEEKERVEQGTQVINNDNSINLGIGYTFNNRFSITGVIPYIFIDRSSLYEHLGQSSGQRFHTQSQGLGDIRVVGYMNTMPSYTKGRVVAGLGFKAPTGNYNAKDYFHKADGLTLLPVDQSIQPGDGGWGIIAELDLSHQISGNVHGYINGMYLANPRNTNGTARSPENTTGVEKGNIFSVADQYLLRVGARVKINSFQAALGGRMECIPTRDLIGKEQGFRRPGYAMSAEPSLFYTRGQHTLGVNVPIVFERNRTRSELDKERTKVSGTYQHGDAAFADWLLSVTYAYQLHH
jgi:hypothetical protein